MPPSNPIRLFNTTRSKLGRYRGGGAVQFDGHSSYGILRHSDEYNFTHNQYYPLAESGFTMQLVVHPVRPRGLPPRPAGSVGGTIACKSGEWQLLMLPDATVSWQVRMASGWVFANSTTALAPDEAYVIKVRKRHFLSHLYINAIILPRQARDKHRENSKKSGVFSQGTHEGGRVKLFICQLTADFRCPLRQPEGVGQGVLPLHSGASDVWFGARGRSSADGSLLDAFSGAFEEIHLQKLSLENATAAVWPGGPAAGPVNYYMYDYSNAAARSYWANRTARLINEVGAVTAQWDGAEFQPCAALWDVPHSNRTFNSGLWLAEFGGVRFYSNGQGPGHLQWPSYTLAAFDASRQLWQQPMATEFSLSFGGLGPWRGDMTPLGDEGTTLANLGVCRGGGGMILQILKVRRRIYYIYLLRCDACHFALKMTIFTKTGSGQT